MTARRQVTAMRRVVRAMAALADSARLANHRLIVAWGREWQHPDSVLSEDEIEAIDARSMGRTLEAIDDIPEKETAE